MKILFPTDGSEHSLAALRSLVSHPSEWNADVVAMGRGGCSAIAGVLMGSVTQNVLAIITIPVLLLP